VDDCGFRQAVRLKPDAERPVAGPVQRAMDWEELPSTPPVIIMVIGNRWYGVRCHEVTRPSASSTKLDQQRLEAAFAPLATLNPRDFSPAYKVCQPCLPT
jgi:hypothetical protein